MVKIREHSMTWNHLHDMRKYYNFIYSSSIQTPFVTLQMSQRQSDSSHSHRSTSRSTCLRPLWSCKLTWPHSYRTSMIVQQNGAPSGMCHSSAVFPGKWIGREEPTAWLPPSPCLTPCGSWMLWCLYVRGPHEVYQAYEASLVGFERN
jgi:hypothetical protein